MTRGNAGGFVPPAARRAIQERLMCGIDERLCLARNLRVKLKYASPDCAQAQPALRAATAACAMVRDSSTCAVASRAASSTLRMAQVASSTQSSHLL